MPGCDDAGAEGRVGFEFLDEFDAVVWRAGDEVVFALDALRGEGRISAADEWHAGQPGVIEFCGGFVEV